MKPEIAHRLAVAHQSDPSCLARLRFETENPQPSGEAAVVGTLCHEIIEHFTFESAEHEGATAFASARAVIGRELHRPEVTEAVIEDVLSIIGKAFGPKSRLRLGLPPSPWEVVPEWTWFLDDEFRPVLAADPQESIAFEGAIDRLSIHRTAGGLEIHDWKSTIARESNDDIEADRQARYYSVAVLAHFPAARSVKFNKVFLRHGYAAWHEFKRDEPWYEETKSRMRVRRAKRLQALASGAWPEAPGLDCAYCPIYFECPSMIRNRAIGKDHQGDDTESANLLLMLRAGANVLEKRLRQRAELVGPIPLGDDDGSALGRKVVTRWEVVRPYEETLNHLESMGMTPAQREEWFRFVAEHNYPGAVKKALVALTDPKTAKALIENTGEWLEPYAAEEFGVWVPPAKAESPLVSQEKFETLVDRAIGGT